MIRKSEDLPEIVVLYTSADRGITCDLADKKGTSPDRWKSVRGFFLPGPLSKIFSRRMGMKQEQANLKMTLLLIKDWDGFQVAMRAVMQHSDTMKHAAWRIGK